MAVLILAPPEDLHAAAVRKHLDVMGVEVRSFTFADLLDKGGVAVSLTGSAFSCRLDLPAHDEAAETSQLDLSGLKSVWLRRVGTVTTGEFPEAWMASVSRNETARALDGMLRSIETLWVNDPAAEHDALLKVVQLRAAQQSGLAIPETLVTNQPEQVRAFFERCGGDMIYKFIDEGSHRFFPLYESPRGMPTLPFRREDLEHLEQVRYAMHLFQRHIHKTCDVRVTIIGQRLFAVRIDSQLGRGKVDWRLDYSVPMGPHELPAELEQACLQLMRTLRLNFGALDFCIDEDGRHFFLEVNPSGQFLWMENRLEIPLSLELARLLAGESPPLVA